MTAPPLPQRWFLWVLLGGAAIRILWALLVPVHPVSDSAAYDQLARNLAFQGTYQWDSGDLTAYWPVGTSFAYSLLYRLFGHVYWPAAVFNVAIGIASLALIMALARRWLGDRPALTAGILYAFWPSQIQFTTVLAAELMFNFLVLAALWLGLELRRGVVPRAILAGVLLAGAAYVRPQALLLPGLVALFLIWRERPQPLKKALVRAALFAVTAWLTVAVCIAPWAARNTSVFGQPVLISTNGGPVTWMGNNPATDGMYTELPTDIARMNEAVRAKILGDEARDYILAKPIAFVWRCIVKLVRTHERETIGVHWNIDGLTPLIGEGGVTPLKAASTLYWIAVLLLAVGGLVLVARRERWWTLLNPTVAIWAYFAAVHAVTLAQDRYHFPSIPYIAMLAALVAARWWPRSAGAAEHA